MRTEDKNFLIVVVLIIFMPIVAILGIFLAGFFNLIFLIPVPMAIYVLLQYFILEKRRARPSKSGRRGD